MKKSRFDIISDLFKLSNVISGSLKLAESLADKSSGSDETDCKDICRNIRYNLKPLSFLLAGIREYVTEHEDKELTTVLFSTIHPSEVLFLHRHVRRYSLSTK